MSAVCRKKQLLFIFDKKTPNVRLGPFLETRPAHLCVRLWFLDNAYCSTGYTEACFLSLPFLSNFSTPSTLANNVSSPPMPTLMPG